GRYPLTTPNAFSWHEHHPPYNVTLPPRHGVGLSAYTPPLTLKKSLIPKKAYSHRVRCGVTLLSLARGEDGGLKTGEEKSQWSIVHRPSSKRFPFVPGAKGISFHKSIFDPRLGMGMTIPNTQLKLGAIQEHL